MLRLLVLCVALASSPAYAATTFSVWTQDEFEMVKPNTAAGTSTSLTMETAKLSYGSGQIIARCADDAGSTTCTGVDLTLPDLVMTGGPTLAIASTTNTGPVQVNFTTAHGLSSQAMLKIASTGIGALDGNVYYVTVVDADSVTLNGTAAPGSTTATGSAQHAIHKNNLVAYKGDTQHIFTPSAPPTLMTKGEFPWRLIPGYVGAEKKDPYYLEARTVFPVSINTVSKVYREWWSMPNVAHLSNANNPHNLLTNGHLARSLTGWTLTSTGTGSLPAWSTSSTDGIAQFVGGATGTSKIEQCVRTRAGWWYTLVVNVPSGTGTAHVQVGTTTGLADLVADTSMTTTGQVEWAGTDATPCIQVFASNGSAQAKKIFLARALNRDLTLRVTPTSAGWTDVSSGGTVSHSSSSGGTLTLDGTSGTAALETPITVEANTTYVIYGNNSSINVQVGTTSGGTELKASGAIAGESLVSFTTGATSGTAYLRLTKSTAGAANMTDFYVTTPLSTGRVTVTGTYTTTARKEYLVEITQSGGAATTPVGQFSYSDDGGATWSAATNIAASVAINNGLTLNFANTFNDGERVTFYADSARNQPIWLDVYADSSVPAGVYTGTVAVASNSPVTSTNVPLTVTVLPLTIPAENIYTRTYYGLGEGILQDVHTGGATKKELHKLYSKGCLRNHITCGSNLGRYPSWTWDGSGAVTATNATGMADVNEIGKLLMDGVDTYASLGIYTTPKGAKWTSLLFPRNPSGTSAPTADSATAYDTGSVNLTKHLNMMTDPTNGWMARVLSCTTVGCDAANSHEDWADDTERNLVYGIDEPALSSTLGTTETSLGQTFREFHDNLLSALPGYAHTFGTTHSLLRAGANDGPSVRNKWDIWFPVGANANQGYGKPAGTGFVNDGLYAQRQDYLDAGARVIGVYDACQSQSCTLANGIENLEPLDFRANSTLAGETGFGTYDGLARWTTDETFAAQRIWSWQQFHWGRPTYYLYYTVVDASDNYRGCLTGLGFYASSRGQKNGIGDCVGLDEAAFQFSAASDGSYLFPGKIADWGGTNDMVIETYVLKQLRNMIRDNTLLHLAWANAKDGGTEVRSLVERGLSSNVRMRAGVRDNAAAMRGMVRELNRLAASTVSVNRPRLSAYPRALTGQYPKP